MMQLKIGSKGELVIPKKIREHLGILKDRIVILELDGKAVKISAGTQDVVSRWAEQAKKMRIDMKNIVYGDKLYEEIFP